MRNRIVAIVALALLAGVAALLAAPRPPHLAGAVTGDAALAAQLRAAAGDPDGYRGLAVALIGPGGVRTAGIGDRGDGGPVTADTPFEIGSIAKAFTGMLLADSGVAPGERLRTLVPSVTGPAGDVTVDELSSHRSGLRSVPVTSVGQAARLYFANLGGGDPYAGQDRDWLLRTADGQRPGGGRGTMNYSNFGAAVLGQALAERAGVPYPRLLRDELLGPLGMSATTVSSDGTALPAGHASGSTASGRKVEPWRGAGWAPAGIGVWSTAADLARLVTAVHAGAAPGLDALTPRHTVDDRERVGHGWFTTRYDNATLTWHNGGTGGFRSYLAVDRGTGRGVVVLGNTDRDVDPIGRRLLGVTPPGPADPSRSLLKVLVTVGLSLIGAAGLFVSVRLAARGHIDRVRLATSVLWSAVMLLLAYRAGDWLAVPVVVWALGVAATVAALCPAVPSWRTLPLVTGRPWLRWTGAVVSAAVAASAVVLVT
ncbi:serine hydrolase domain-containing protein [Dactylosporangium sp. NPDC005555]|uniref:serine hydrolase domain-containing protein n=1 Tax=Dactylosporangium sp. NPDC005555 TaxID=3154889 RepID=UPI0033B35419